MKENYNKFFSGTEENDSIAEFDDTFDDLAVKKECVLPEKITDVHYIVVLKLYYFIRPILVIPLST